MAELRTAFVAYRVRNDDQEQIGDPYSELEGAMLACEAHAHQVTHGRFVNVFDERGVSLKLDLKTGKARPWPQGCGYEIHQVEVFMEEESKWY